MKRHLRLLQKRVKRGDFGLCVSNQGSPKSYRLCYDGLSTDKGPKKEVVLSVSGIMVKSDFCKMFKDIP